MSSSKRDYTLEREARREDTRRKRQERVMCAYVKHAHPAVYKEMCDVYEELNEKHPNTRDLRKTVDFIRLRRRVENERKPQKNTRELCLEIPLMRSTTTTTTTTTTSPPAVSVSTPMSPPVVLTPLPTASSPPPVPTASSPPPVPTASSPPPVLPPVPDDTYQELLEELQKDSDLWQIFHDFPVEELDPLVAQDLGDINGISPLEVELH